MVFEVTDHTIRNGRQIIDKEIAKRGHEIHEKYLR
jgi:hypothetical protein